MGAEGEKKNKNNNKKKTVMRQKMSHNRPLLKAKTNSTLKDNNKKISF